MKNLIKELAKEIAEEKGFFLISLAIKGSNKKPVIEVFIDSRLGITADDCADFSKVLKEKLELTDYRDLDYQLVISSPGINEPLRFIEQYHKHINRDFNLSYQNNDAVLSIEAKLIEVTGENLVFKYKNELLNIDFNKIKKAKVKISF